MTFECMRNVQRVPGPLATPPGHPPWPPPWPPLSGTWSPLLLRWRPRHALRDCCSFRISFSIRPVCLRHMVWRWSRERFLSFPSTVFKPALCENSIRYAKRYRPLYCTVSVLALCFTYTWNFAAEGKAFKLESKALSHSPRSALPRIASAVPACHRAVRSADLTESE